jgi:DNA repair protein RadC
MEERKKIYTDFQKYLLDDPPAIEYGAAAVILAHNHPSGIITPSAADIEITRRVVEAGKIIGIPLVDHVIIGKNKFVSIEADY